MAPITINGNELDISTAPPQFFPPDAADSKYILVQCEDRDGIQQNRLTTAEIADLHRVHVEIKQFVGNGTYLCRYKPADLKVIEALPFVKHAVVYHPHFVIHEFLKSGQTPGTESISSGSPDQPSSPQQVLITLHEHSQKEADNALVAINGIVHEDAQVITPRLLRVQADQKQLEDLAALDAVRTIEPDLVAEPCAVAGRAIMKVWGNSPAYGGKSHEGYGQVVAVTDTGFDNGKWNFNLEPLAFRNRVVGLMVQAGITGTEATGADVKGHGTHVAGCVLANDNSVTGSARGASLFVISRKWVNENIPEFYTLTYTDPRTGNKLVPRINNGSWATAPFKALSTDIATQSGYMDASAGLIDDAMYKDRGLLIVLAAGNDGDIVTDTDCQIGATSAAKNALVVGASLSVRPMDKAETHRNLYYDSGPKKMRFTADCVANFSSRGPTKPGVGVPARVAPHVVAPGCAILSMWSRSAPTQTPFGYWPGPNATDQDQFRIMQSGTSMAAPLVSGVAATLRGMLVESGTTDPSGALLKALIVNGCDDISHGVQGVYYQTPPDPPSGPAANQVWSTRPNNGPENGIAGFGRVNLQNSAWSITGQSGVGGTAAKGGYIDTLECITPVHEGTAPNDRSRRKVEVTIVTPSPGSVTFKVTLCYTDKRGAVLVNVLKLKVTSSTGETRFSTIDNPTVVNNTQQVVWTQMPAGKAVIEVETIALEVAVPATTPNPFKPQPFALAWSMTEQQ